MRSTIHRRRASVRARAALAIPIAAILLVGVLAGPAHAETGDPQTETAAPAPSETPEQATPDAPATEQAPDAPEPETADDDAVPVLSQATQTVRRDAVPTRATGFQLRYAFAPGVQPANPRNETDVAAEQKYDWADAGIHYLAWDYPMPDDGHHEVTFTAQLIDHGTLTDYTVEYTSKVNRTSGSLSVETDCAILQDGAPVDFQNESPFACEGSSTQGASGAVLASAKVALYNWSTITGIIDVRNVSHGPVISLAEGTFSTANQQKRILMNGEAWYPVDADVEHKRALPYATIENGAQLTWSAAQQNFGREQSEPDTHAQASFAYRILLDGRETPYWISGWAENYKYLSGSEPSATCSIYLGDPNTTGVRVLENTPFTCEPTGMSKPNVKTDDDTTFQVRMAKVDTVTTDQDARDRGIVDACGEHGNGCIQAIGEPTLDTAEAGNPRTIATQPHTAGSDEPQEWKFERTWSQEVRDSVEQTFGIKLSYEAEYEPMPGETFKQGVELSSETSYGYDLTKGLEYTLTSYPKIPFGAVGRMVQYEAWDVYTGELYFFGEGNSWYRLSGTSIRIPVDASMFGAESKTFAGHVDAQEAPVIGGVEFRCSWQESARANVLLHNPTVEQLTLCDIPVSWGDEVPHIRGLDVDPDLLKDARAVLADDLAALEKELEKRKSELAELRQG
ncbi:hypothetical protein [Microbacterium sp. zg.Y909]|uniref:hypothetical protein n=1 Tax=Microbacterium sp. zg.Y909 TaxID=2969413 RepID=UPI00214C7B7F|nr:hypothetical protein [Microbacterium sp. zg.Y909]MCR2825874.1 hypothetical protein [Microbacterium sp. zg.Y909]